MQKQAETARIFILNKAEPSRASSPNELRFYTFSSINDFVLYQITLFPIELNNRAESSGVLSNMARLET